MKRKYVFFKLKFCFWTKFKANSVCLLYSPKPLLKKIMKRRSSLTWRQSKKCKICVRISKTIIRLLLFWEATMQECFQNKFAVRSSHQDTFFNIAVLQLWWNSLKNSCDGMQYSVNFHITLSSFAPLLQKSYISSQH